MARSKIERVIDNNDWVTESSFTSPLPKMTYEEFLACEEIGTHVEWVDGEVIFMGEISFRHQFIVAFLTALLQHYVESNHLGIVLCAPCQMRLRVIPSGRQPDVMFIDKARLDLVTRSYFDGACDLAVEVISPWSRTRDRRDKFREYETAGVREYWIIDPQRDSADFYLHQDDGKFHSIDVGSDGIFRSRALAGLYIRTEWLRSDPLPPLLSILREWKIV